MPRINILTPVRFKCQDGCSSCCKTGGFVLIADDDIIKIAGFLKISREVFLKRYIKREGRKLYLIDRPDKNDCIFLKDDKCSIYDVRPIQCRTFPFWPQNVKSEKRWNFVSDECPGIGEGKEYYRQDILDVFNGKSVDSEK